MRLEIEIENSGRFMGQYRLLISTNMAAECHELSLRGNYRCTTSLLCTAPAVVIFVVRLWIVIASKMFFSHSRDSLLLSIAAVENLILTTLLLD